MKLYHVREDERRGGGLDARDEEECYTAAGRTVGIWLTTEANTDPTTFMADVDPSAVAEFEVAQSEEPHRVFIVPGALVATMGFTAA
jgi:hypothetical protein